MNKILLIALILLSNSLLASDVNDQLADNCGRYAKVLTKDYEFSQYIKSSNRDIRKILIRDLVSTEAYRSTLETLKPKNDWAKILDNNCLFFYPVESKLVSTFKKNEALFIHYNSKYILNTDDGEDLGPLKDQLKLIEKEALLILNEVKKFAENLSLSYIVIQPAITVTQTIKGEQTTLKNTSTKSFKFYTQNYKDWLKEEI